MYLAEKYLFHGRVDQATRSRYLTAPSTVRQLNAIKEILDFNPYTKRDTVLLCLSTVCNITACPVASCKGIRQKSAIRQAEQDLLALRGNKCFGQSPRNVIHLYLTDWWGKWNFSAGLVAQQVMFWKLCCTLEFNFDSKKKVHFP